MAWNAMIDLCDAISLYASSEAIHLRENMHGYHSAVKKVVKSRDEIKSCVAEESLYPCSFKCGIGFYRLLSLEKHEAEVHRNEVFKPFACDVCGKMFTSRLKKRNHELKHGIYYYHCQECNVGFVSKKEYDEHRLEHGDGFPFYCEENDCDFGCITFLELKRHRFLHNGFPYICECGKGFTDKVLFEKHTVKHFGYLVEHHGEGTVKVDVNLLRTLERRETFTKKKKIKCTQCDAKFGFQALLDNHVRIAHDQSSVYF